ncbi:hypothetical protein AYO44_02650 [Planctomycetaceae bacterium SCGC AG-212-F19]|nr:hypothetical protein AYO44_02650 [Planctomycetaceae bacterium SCGC AG-212-F19]
MPAPATADDFLEMLRKSGVVPASRLDAAVDALRAAGTLPGQPQALADLLIRDGLVTHFQVQNFLQGKYLGFVLGNYRILDLLGSGGMSAVYLCEDFKAGKRLALKVLPRSLARDPTILRRFYREARASFTLDHPNIVRGYEVGQENNQHFFVMEYVEGQSLQEIVHKTGPLPVDRAVEYVRQAAVGLQHAYEAGLVHRDIKPGNLLIDRTGTIKILDMGLSRFYNDEDSVLTKDVLGTLDYLAPEQAEDSHTVDTRADIYALGGTFYYILTAQSPLSGDTLDPRAIAQHALRRRPIRDLRPEVPESLIAIVNRMMAVDATKRFPNPAAVANALRHWQQGVTAPPEPETEPAPAPTPRPRPTQPGKVGTTAKRLALRWAMIGGGLLLVLGVVVVVWWMSIRP